MRGKFLNAKNLSGICPNKNISDSNEVSLSGKYFLDPSLATSCIFEVFFFISPRWSSGKLFGSLPKWLGFKALGRYISPPGFGS